MSAPQGHDDEHAVDEVQEELDHPSSEPPADVDPTDPDTAGSAGS